MLAISNLFNCYAFNTFQRSGLQLHKDLKSSQTKNLTKWSRTIYRFYWSVEWIRWRSSKRATDLKQKTSVLFID